MRLHHLAILCRDVERVAGFYRDLLGLEERARHEDEAGVRSVWLGLDDGVIMVERGQPAPAGGWHLLALSIRASERAHWRERIAAAGAGPTHETPSTLYGRDPEGNRFGLSHYPLPGASPRGESIEGGRRTRHSG